MQWPLCRPARGTCAPLRRRTPLPACGSRAGASAAGLGAAAWLRRHALVLATGLAAALPIVVVVIRAVAAGWAPLGDNAIIAVRAYDVFTAHSPLVGQSSGGATSVLDQRAFSPGPLLFWLLAVQARFLDPVWMAMTAGLVNVASVMGAVALARRRGGLLLMFATAIAIAVMLRSIPTQAYSDVWNPWMPLLPFLLLDLPGLVAGLRRGAAAAARRAGRELRRPDAPGVPPAGGRRDGGGPRRPGGLAQPAPAGRSVAVRAPPAPASADPRARG